MSRCMMAAAFLVFAGTGWAQTTPAQDSLTVFKAGDTARAAAVNANFKLVWNRLNSLAAENQKLAKQVDSLRKAPGAGGDSQDSRLPIGTVVASLLPPTEFYASFSAKTWMLADGSPAPASYVTAFKTENLPDLRGVFLRGVNQGRGDAFSDPAGTARAPGSLQGDATRRPDSAFIVSNGGAHTHVLDLEAGASRNYAATGAPVAA
jgi:hypothetical protein